MMNKSSAISMLVGRSVTAVCFVMDFVEFHFDGPILRALSNPILEFRGNECAFPSPGARDALCAVIGSTVESIGVDDDSSIRARLDSGHTIVVPLDQGSRLGPEAAHFVSEADHVMDVW